MATDAGTERPVLSEGGGDEVVAGEGAGVFVGVEGEVAVRDEQEGEGQAGGDLGGRVGIDVADVVGAAELIGEERRAAASSVAP
ncbi:hypothetical protein [Nocardia sp. NPDC004260]